MRAPAATGAVAGPWGAAAGALIGAVGGGLGAHAAEEAEAAAAKEARRQEKRGDKATRRAERTAERDAVRQSKSAAAAETHGAAAALTGIRQTGSTRRTLYIAGGVALGLGALALALRSGEKG
jgi:hypothetical protein